MKKISVVIPCYNSEKMIKNVVENDMKIFNDKQINDYEFILVNDCSKDNTWSAISELSHIYTCVTAVNLAKNCGQHGAIMAGFKYISGEYIIVSDDDGQTNMDVVDQIVAKLDEGYDVVSTVWKTRGERSLFRRFGSRMSVLVSDALLDNKEKKPVSIFFGAKRFIIEEIKRYDNPYPYIIGLILRTTNNIGVVETEQLERQSGQSGYSFTKLLGLWLNGFTAFSIKPLRVASYVGMASAFIGFAMGIYIVIRKIIDINVAVGWSSIIAILLFMFGLVLAILGLIGEYIGRIYICINKSPQYVIKEIDCNKEK